MSRTAREIDPKAALQKLRKYLDRCPYCDHGELHRSFADEAPARCEMLFDVHCHGCKAVWTEAYRLYEVVPPPPDE
jgi:hypothetical protein